MKKIFIAVLTGLLLGTMPAANAEIATSSVDCFNKSQINFCGYAMWAQRATTIRAKIQTYQLRLEKNPDDTETRRELAKSWYELGCVYNAEEYYEDAVDAFSKAVELEPDNREYRKSLDDARENLKNNARHEREVPKFNGLG